MRIVLVTKEYPPENPWGGIATATRHLALGLHQAGQEVRVVAWTAEAPRTESPDGFPVDFIASSKQPAWAVALRGAPMTRECLHFAAAVDAHLQQLATDWPFDIVEAPETLAPLSQWAKNARCPWVTRLYTPFALRHQWNNGEIEGAGPFDLSQRSRLERKQALAGKGLCAPSKFMADEVARLWSIPSERVAILPNPFQLEELEETQNLVEEFDVGTYALYFGSAERRKGVHVLADIAEDFLTAVPDTRLLCAGKDLDKILLGTHEHVLVFHHQRPERLYPLIRKARIVVLPSLKENFPMACLEAMSLGKVVIGTRNTGMAEIIEDGKSGFLVEPGNADALKAKMLEVWHRDDLDAIGEAAKARAATFTPEVLIPRIVDFYENIRRVMRV